MDISKRLHEQRQIKLAKEILESNGYEVSDAPIKENDEKASQEYMNNMRNNATYKELAKICSANGYRLKSAHIAYGKPYITIATTSAGESADEYIPDIYYDNRENEFTIQTYSHGALTIKEHDEFLERITIANDTVKELMKVDLSGLYDLGNK